MTPSDQQPDPGVPANPPMGRLLDALKDPADALTVPRPKPDDAAILTALSSDEEDEATYKLLAATHDEDEGPSIRIGSNG